MTAVEWLVNEIDMQYPHIDIRWKQWMINQAKEIEQEQRIKDYNAGYQDGQCNHINNAENYVNEQNYLNDGTTSI